MTALFINLTFLFTNKEQVCNTRKCLLFIADTKNHAESVEVSGSEKASVVNTQIRVYTCKCFIKEAFQESFKVRHICFPYVKCLMKLYYIKNSKHIILF